MDAGANPFSSWPAPEPATHLARVRAPMTLGRPQTRSLMGGRVKPGHDGINR